MGTNVGDLIAALDRERLPQLERTSFFTLLRFLEHCEEQAARLGGDGPLLHEAVRLRHSPELAFSAGEIESVARTRIPQRVEEVLRDTAPQTNEQAYTTKRREHRYEVVTTLLGLTGGVSPLPTYLAEEIALLDRRDDPQNAFLDLFHHRFLGLLYRAVTKHELAHELDDTSNGGWVDRLLGLCGFDHAGGQHLHFLAWQRVVRIAPLLVTRTRTSALVAQALNVLLGEHLRGGQCTIFEYRGGWTALDISGQIRLNLTRLGKTTGLGSRVYTPSASIRIEIGPLNEESYSEFLRGQPAYFALCEALILLLDDPIDFELELVVSAGDRHSASLGLARLSRDAWLGSTQTQARRVNFTGSPRDLESVTGATPSFSRSTSPSAAKEPMHAR